MGTGCCLPKTIRPKLEGDWARGAFKIFGTPYVFLKPFNFKFGTQLGFGINLPKNNVLDQNCRGSGPGQHQRKTCGTQYVFLQPLKLATSNLVHKLGLGLAYQKTTLWTKIGGGLCQGSIQTKCGTPYVFLQPLKLTTSNVVHKLGLALT